MHEFTGNLLSASFDYVTGKTVVSIALNERQPAMTMLDELRNTVEKLSIKIDKYREKRSLNANSYAWALMTKIGNVTRHSKEEVYLDMLKHYGQGGVVSIEEKHVDNFKRMYKYHESLGKSKLKGKTFEHFRFWVGTSEYNTHEMSIFLDGIIYEAQQLGIQTETPDQIAKMKSLWGE
jgi:hypothetical protein